MPQLDDREQLKKIKDIRTEEEEVFVQKMASKFGLQYIDLGVVSIETDALSVLPEAEARDALIAPFHIQDKKLDIAVKSPNYPKTKEVLDKLSTEYEITKHLASTASLERAWEHYQDLSLTEKTRSGILDISEEGLKKRAAELKTNELIKGHIDTLVAGDPEHETTELMEIIFGGAIATDSSDVHFEPQQDGIRTRLRQDGVLQDVTHIEPSVYKPLLTRIKILAKMKITRTTQAQDGRFTISHEGVDVEVRVSVVPSAYGEAIVLRILNPKAIGAEVEDLGMEKKLYKLLLREIKKPNGMILNTGPTGSGKTTTLYAFLKKVYTPDKKILTIEDPIEYHLEGISQTQVDSEKGYDFLSGLRAAMRQDPDIIMVGEIRDSETARVAVNASLTGHLVLSTLHTNNAAGVIPRLLDLGVSSHILATSLSVSIAQRLVRRVCTSCKEEVQPTPEQEKVIRRIIQHAEENGKNIRDHGISTSDITLYRGKGCEKCNGLGYKGRVGIFEAIITNEEIEELLNKNPSEQEVRRIAEKQGILNLQEDGVVKMLRGDTSFEEIEKVVNLEVEGDDAPAMKKKEEKVKKEEEKVSLPTNKEKESRPSPVSANNTLEISLLVDYLKRLEEEQTVKPDESAEEKIKLTQELILDLLKNQAFNGKTKESEEIIVKKEIDRIMQELRELEEEQRINPTQATAKRLKRIRHEIEAL